MTFRRLWAAGNLTASIREPIPSRDARGSSGPGSRPRRGTERRRSLRRGEGVGGSRRSRRRRYRGGRTSGSSLPGSFSWPFDTNGAPRVDRVNITVTVNSLIHYVVLYGIPL